uniref:Uncharacterized protein n=1 Tax=Romanomermis culicivorax TaxID=13658 RepID=A0A915HVL4_ROMCU
MKCAFNNQTSTLPVCGQIRVAGSTIVQAHGPVVTNTESKFGNYPVKRVVLDDDRQDLFIIGTEFCAHPKINAALNFKDKIGNKSLPLHITENAPRINAQTIAAAAKNHTTAAASVLSFKFLL